MPDVFIPEKLEPFVAKKKRYKIAIGGRGSGKSMTFGILALMSAQTEGTKTMCFREYQNSIDDSVISLLAGQIRDLKLQGFEVQSTKIMYNGEDAFKFRGLARNPEGVKSSYGFTRFWVEEAQTISSESLKNLAPTLREEGSELWFSANPRSSADPFSQRFIKPFEKQIYRDGYYEDDQHLIILVNHSDNPMLPSVLEEERLNDKVIMERALYEHVWEGRFYDEVQGSIIPVDWYDAAIDAHKKLGFAPQGAVIASFDPSDLGPDSKGYALRHGSVILDVCEKTDGDVTEGTNWALAKAIEEKADWFVWDCDGLGVALKSQVETALNGKKMSYFMFKGSERVEKGGEMYRDDTGKTRTNRDAFFNKRSQYYRRLRDRFYNTYRAVKRGDYVHPDDMISLSSKISCLDELRAEVCRIPKKANASGKFQVMSKLEMSKKPYEIPSPNMADALMMNCFMPDSTGELTQELEFKGWL